MSFHLLAREGTHTHNYWIWLSNLPLTSGKVKGKIKTMKMTISAQFSDWETDGDVAVNDRSAKVDLEVDQAIQDYHDDK